MSSETSDAGVSRRRFVGYLAAAPALALAAQIGLDGLTPTTRCGVEPVITSYAKAPVRTVTAGDTTYTYRELGPKGGIPVVFFVHLAGNLDNWDPRIIDAIAAHCHVITFDNKGVGASTGSVPATIEEAADDAYTFIQALGFDLIDAFGFSMGGMIAQDLVLAHPELIRKLVLTGTGPRGGKDMDKVVGTTYWDIVRFGPDRVGSQGVPVLQPQRQGQAGRARRSSSGCRNAPWTGTRRSAPWRSRRS